MYGYVGWGLFVLILLIFIVQQKRHIAIIMSGETDIMLLLTYIKWMLLDDAMRDNHKGKFKEFLKTTSFEYDADLFIATDHAIEEMVTVVRNRRSLQVVMSMIQKEIKN